MTKLRTTVIMKTDVRDSTPLFRSLAEEGLSRVLSEQKQLVSSLVQQHEGHIVKGEGDAFWVTFASVTAAVETAIAIQEALKAQQLGKITEGRVAVRIVISLGDVLHQNNDIFGYPVNLVARMETVTPADEIYLSQAAWLALNQAEIRTEAAGEYTFKGVAQPEMVYRVVQPNKSRFVHNQTIIVIDLRGFTAYQKSHTISEVEQLLIQIERIVRTACEQHSGIIRFSTGDGFFLSFAEPAAALSAVARLCQEWHRFSEERGGACLLSIGVNQGDLTIFRSYLFGEHLNQTYWLQQFSNGLQPLAAGNHVAVSGRVQALLAGTVWQEQLNLIDSTHLSGLPEGMAGQSIYQLVLT
jgi:class 3 adenylate cyclase